MVLPQPTTFCLLCTVIALSAAAQLCLFFSSFSRHSHPSGFALSSPYDPHQAAEEARLEHASLVQAAALTSPATRLQLASALASWPRRPLPQALQEAAWQLAAVERLGGGTGSPPGAQLPGLHPWVVYFVTPWFGARTHKWLPEAHVHVCPSACQLAAYSSSHLPLWQRADLALYFPGPGAGERLLPPAAAAINSTTLHALFFAENFAPIFSSSHVARFAAQVSYRQGGLWHDDEYLYSALPAATAAAAASAPFDFNSATWQGLFPAQPPLPPSQRTTLLPPSPSRSIVSWATTHCASRSGREELVAALELLPAGQGLAVDAYGPPGACCLCAPWRHTGPAAAPALLAESAHAPPFPLQEALLRTYKFALALENSLCPDYVTEKALQALARGVVPVVLSAPTLAAHLPPGSYIDVRDFSSVAALAAHLRALDANASAYAQHFAWRAVPFGAWGQGQGSELRRVLQQVLPWMSGEGSRGEEGSSSSSSSSGLGAAQQHWYACSLCDALDAAAASGGGGGGAAAAAAGASPWQARSAALWAAVRARSSNMSSAHQGAQACAPPIVVEEDAAATLRFPTAASAYQPPHRPTHLPWLRRAVAQRDEERRVLVLQSGRGKAGAAA